MVVLKCPIPGCEFKTDDVEVVGAAAIITIHGQVHASDGTDRAPKLERPIIKANGSCEDWNAFCRRWETFRTGSKIRDSIASGQLLECATEELKNIVLRAHPNFTSMSLANALPVLKSLAVIPVALGVMRAELSALKQDPGEPFRIFAA